MSKSENDWFLNATPCACCCNGAGGRKCDQCEPDGFCDYCETFEGRGIEQICEYASTCDGCGELVHHDLQRIPPGSNDQLGYCWDCRPDLFENDEESFEP